MGRGEIERLAGLTPNLVSCLVLFDVLEPVDERFAWRDLVAAREAARLLKRGVAIGDVLQASIALRPARRQSRRGAAGRGALGRAAARGRRPARRALGPAHDVRPMRPAEAAQHRRSCWPRRRRPRSAGDHATAESLYTTAMRADAADPGAALQPRQRVPGAGPRGRGQGGVADRGGARSGVRRGLVQSRPGGRGRGSRPTSPSPSIAAP